MSIVQKDGALRERLSKQLKESKRQKRKNAPTKRGQKQRRGNGQIE